MSCQGLSGRASLEIAWVEPLAGHGGPVRAPHTKDIHVVSSLDILHIIQREQHVMQAKHSAHRSSQRGE